MMFTGLAAKMRLLASFLAACGLLQTVFMFQTSFAESAIQTRETSLNNPSVLSTSLGCRSLPQYSCWANDTAVIASISLLEKHDLDVGHCCRLCSQNDACKAYNFHTENGRCELLSSETEVTHSATSCAGGYRFGNSMSPDDSDHLDNRPNIVFLVVESTDGRTWSEGYSNGVIPLPNIRELQEGGLEFQRHYSNAPVCCPSRATFWSGRHAHNIPHVNNGLDVGGAWNNYEEAITPIIMNLEC